MEISNTLKTLLYKRGIYDEAMIEEFLSDKPKLTYPPELLTDIEEGAKLILDEIALGHKIMIYGDYDVDGVTATSLMLSILKHLIPEKEVSNRLSYHIPSRFDEGYGLNMDAVKSIAAHGYNLIVTVDCGSSSIDEIEYAKQLGLKVLVTDHHHIGKEIPKCLVVNPKREDSSYPFSELSGCGVAFKLAQVLQKEANLPKSVLTEVLDLVALGTIGDIMPLIDENRTLVKFGMRAINQGLRPGLNRLISGVGLKLGEVTSENIGFIIVPHLNATGRIETASKAVELLMVSEDDPTIDERVEDLIQKNNERRRIQQETFNRSMDIIEKEEKDSQFIVLKLDNGHEGITGIAAGKIKDALYRPTIIVTPTSEEGFLKGTGRSIEGLNIFEILNGHKELFTKFGGHQAACGFTMEKEKFPLLKEAILSDMKAIVEAKPSILDRSLDCDLDIDLSDISLSLCEEINLLMPFGTKNKKPTFRISDMVVSDLRYMGQEGNHASFNLKSSFGLMEGDLTYIRGVIFNRAIELESVLYNGAEVDVIGTLEINKWNGKSRVQITCQEIFPAGEEVWE